MGDTRRSKLLVIPAVLAVLAVGLAAPASASFTSLPPTPPAVAPAPSSLTASVETPIPSNGTRLSWSRTPAGPRPYFGARYYGSRIGRFTTVDPLYTWNDNLLDPQRWNRYSYVRNNPFRYVDPDGRGIASKAVKLIVKGGDVAATFKGVLDDAAVLLSADATVGTGARLLAAASLASELLPVSGRDVREGTELAARVAREGEFSIFRWTDYPEGLPKPSGPFRVVEGAEYEAARKAANSANRSLHRADPTLAGKQVHEIQPVKLGGNPTDPENKIPLDRQEHARATTWWNRLMHDVKDK